MHFFKLFLKYLLSSTIFFFLKRVYWCFASKKKKEIKKEKKTKTKTKKKQNNKHFLGKLRASYLFL